MAKLRINGDSSGYVDLEAPNAASSSTLDLDQVPQKNVANTFSANTQVITAASDAEALHIKGRSSDDIGQMKFMENDGTTSLGRLDARTTKFEMASYSELHLSANGPNNAHLKIDASGRVTMPNQPAFGVRGNTWSVEKFLGGTVFSNIGNHFSTTTGLFTAPVAGTYNFNFTLTTSDTQSHFVDLFKNGSSVFGHSLIYGVIYNTGSMTINVTLAAGDTMSAHKRGAGYAVYNALFSGFLIG
jgi:hypothetical protein